MALESVKSFFCFFDCTKIFSFYPPKLKFFFPFYFLLLSRIFSGYPLAHDGKRNELLRHKISYIIKVISSLERNMHTLKKNNRRIKRK